MNPFFVLKFVIGAILLVLFGTCFSQPLSIGNLPSSSCQEENYSVLRRGKNSLRPMCVMKILKPYNVKTGKTVALVSLNGKITKILLKKHSVKTGRLSKSQPTLGMREMYLFYSKANNTSVLLDAQVTKSSCYTDTENCCGDDFKGTLIIRKDGSQMVIPVSYYLGG